MEVTTWLIPDPTGHVAWDLLPEIGSTACVISCKTFSIGSRWTTPCAHWQGQKEVILRPCPRRLRPARPPLPVRGGAPGTWRRGPTLPCDRVARAEAHKRPEAAAPRLDVQRSTDPQSHATPSLRPPHSPLLPTPSPNHPRLAQDGVRLWLHWPRRCCPRPRGRVPHAHGAGGWQVFGRWYVCGLFEGVPNVGGCLNFATRSSSTGVGDCCGRAASTSCCCLDADQSCMECFLVNCASFFLVHCAGEATRDPEPVRSCLSHVGGAAGSVFVSAGTDGGRILSGWRRDKSDDGFVLSSVTAGSDLFVLAFVLSMRHALPTGVPVRRPTLTPKTPRGSSRPFTWPRRSLTT